MPTSMKKHDVATIINFCSNESRFISATIEQASLFSGQIIVSVSDHFFNGLPENRSLLDAIYSAFPHCLFIEYPFMPKQVPKSVWKKIDPAHFWHSLSRLLGFRFLNREIERVLFLDADEVPDGSRFGKWLDEHPTLEENVMKFANFWYFREPCYQALHLEDSIVLAKRAALNQKVILHEEERDAIFQCIKGPKNRGVLGVDQTPMFHHYSWVRTQEEMLKKVRAWGHRKDRNWEQLVLEEFQKPFSGKDFIHGYTYQKVACPFPIQMTPPQFVSQGSPQLKRLSFNEVLQLMEWKKFWNFLDF